MHVSEDVHFVTARVQEIFQNRNHRTRMTGIAACVTAGKIATCGDDL